MNRQRWIADGSPLAALRNIEASLDHVLSDETKELLNFHPDQNLHLVVMRLAGEYEELRFRMDGLEK
jgi:hypothetical protein